MPVVGNDVPIVAVYKNDIGMIVIKQMDIDCEERGFVIIHPSDIRSLCAALKKIGREDA